MKGKAEPPLKADIWERQLIQAQERDALQATRPQGCWCLGLGGKGTEWMADEILYKETCTCPEGLAEAERKQLTVDKIDKERRFAYWERAEIPQRFKQMRLSSSPLVKTMPKLIKRLTCPILLEKADEGSSEYRKWEMAINAWDGSWFFSGPCGVGKTGLVISYAYEWMRSNCDNLLFRSLPKLLSELRSTYNKHGNDDQVTEALLLRRYQNVGLLILDDIGSEQVTGTGWTQDRLYQIIGDRHDEGKDMLFTSNLTLAELEKRLGERLTWRIFEMCGKDHVIEVKGPNLRDS